MRGANVLTRAILRPVATGRRTPAWLSLTSLPSRTIRKIQGATSSGNSNRICRPDGALFLAHPLRRRDSAASRMGLEPLGKRRKEFAKGEGSQSRASGCERVIGCRRQVRDLVFWFWFYKYAAPTALGTNAVPKSFCDGRLAECGRPRPQQGTDGDAPWMIR